MKVGIFGQIGNGKSTFARMLLHRLNDSIRMNMAELQLTHVFQLGAFAKAVKEAVAFKFDIPLSDVEKWKNDSQIYPGWNCTMREALQREGENARQIDPKVWIRKVMCNPYPMVIEDGRYENETHAIHESKGYNILIVRPGFDNGSTHPSEKYIGDLIKSIHNRDIHHSIRYFNHLVMNEGDTDDLDNVAKVVSTDILTHYRKYHVS